MRVYLIVAWLFVGLAGVIYHFGPGQKLAELDRLDRTLREARECVASESWVAALEYYDQALSQMPLEQTAASRRVALEKAKAQMMAKQLPEARASLDDLFRELQAEPNPDPQLLADVEAALASSQYYMTWLMRLEGLAKEAWLPEIEAARQHYWQLADRAQQQGDAAAAAKSREDLEAAVRLARMDLAELQGLPLPSQ